MEKDYDELIERLDRGNIVERAIATGLQYGQHDGAHHKDWVIDQMLRIVEDTGDADGVFVIRNGVQIPYADLVKEVGTDE